MTVNSYMGPEPSVSMVHVESAYEAPLSLLLPGDYITISYDGVSVLAAVTEIRYEPFEQKKVKEIGKDSKEISEDLSRYLEI